MTEPKYKRLDLVQQKTLKNWVKVPVMQITDIFPNKKNEMFIYNCYWFTEDKTFYKASFYEDELELV
mgnify:CR=1 FL=1